MSDKPTIGTLLQDLSKRLAEIQAAAPVAKVTAESAITVPTAALLAVVDFLDAIQPFRGPGRGRGLTKPLWDLLLAMQSISDGIAHPMLTPPKTGKRVKSTEQQALMAWAAILFDCYQKTGLTRAHSGEAVAKELQSVKLNNGASLTPPTGRTVAGWVNLMREGAGSAPPAALMAWNRYVHLRAAEPDRAEAVWTAWALDHLRALVAGRLILETPPLKAKD